MPGGGGSFEPPQRENLAESRSRPGIVEQEHDATNVVLVEPDGVGKTMLVKNLLHHGVFHGFTTRFAIASDMLHENAWWVRHTPSGADPRPATGLYNVEGTSSSPSRRYASASGRESIQSARSKSRAMNLRSCRNDFITASASTRSSLTRGRNFPA